MSFYGDMQTLALSLLTEFGQAATLNKRTGGAYDNTQGRVVQTTVQYAIIIAVSKQPETDMGKVFRQRIVYIAAKGLAVTVDTEDTITFGGVTYKVVDPGAINPAGTVVAYKATVEA